MSEPMSCCVARCTAASGAAYCGNCDLLVGLDGLDGLHVIDVAAEEHRLVVTVESAPQVMGCPQCGQASGPASPDAPGVTGWHDHDRVGT